MKCILLIRVSTERQSFDSQTQEVKKRALYDGYKEEDIIIIEDIYLKLKRVILN